jgi:hypothetical protein
MIWVSLALMALYLGACLWDSSGSRVETYPTPIFVLGQHICTVQDRRYVPGRRRRSAPLEWCLIALAISASCLVRADTSALICALLWVLFACQDLIFYMRRAS